MPDKTKLTTLSELGEFKLIEHLTKDFTLQKKSSLKGIGDDAAILDYGDQKLVLTTDLLMEGIHFNLVYTPLKHLGYKAVIVNLSDVYAMNASPAQITVSVAVSNKFSVESLEELYSGIKLACDQYGIDLVGGDTTSSVTGLVISITAVGSAQHDKLVYRDGARKNDLICVTGNLGAAYAGLQILERERKIFESDYKIQPELTNYAYILERQLKPEARKDIIQALSDEEVVPSSMIDLSDGLSSDLLHICKQSGVGCRIFMEKIPVAEETINAAEEFNIEPFICALNGGEDYELLFTVSPEELKKVAQIGGVSMIGHITDSDNGNKLITKEGNEISLQAQGWNSMSED